MCVLFDVISSGGSSSATISVGSTITTQTAISTTLTGGVAASAKFYAEAGTSTSTCEGEGILLCMDTTKSVTSLAATSASNVQHSTTDTTTNQQTHSFTTQVQTSTDASIIDGNGDLFLTVSGTATVSNSITITVTTDAKTGICLTTAPKSFSWQNDPLNTLG